MRGDQSPRACQGHRTESGVELGFPAMVVPTASVMNRQFLIRKLRFVFLRKPQKGGRVLFGHLVDFRLFKPLLLESLNIGQKAIRRLRIAWSREV
jgi:hypothetical protein